MLQGDVPFETESEIVTGYLPFDTQITSGKTLARLIINLGDWPRVMRMGS